MKNEIGVVAPLRSDSPSFTELVDFGLRTCQLISWDPSIYTPALATQVRDEAEDKQVNIAAFWAGWSGPAVWDFLEGPDTLGIVPEKLRASRVDALKKAADFAANIDVPAIITHLGFIPENPTDPRFAEVVEVVRDIAIHCRDRELGFWFETGQETPVTLKRLIEQVDTGNLGINLDPANLILYGKANPIDALDVFGEHVRNVHAKDGLYPTDPMKLGEEVKVGTGKVRFPEFIARLHELGYEGEFIIEREISGEQQNEDIAATIEYLKPLLS